MLAQPGLLGSVAHDQKTEVRKAAGSEFLLHLSEEGYVLLDGEPAYKTKNEGIVSGPALPPRGRKCLSIHAALHEKARTAGFLFEQPAKTGIRREENSGNGVKTPGEVEGRLLDPVCNLLAAAIVEMAQQPC